VGPESLLVQPYHPAYDEAVNRSPTTTLFGARDGGPDMVSPAAELLYPMFQDALEMLALTRGCFLEHDPASLNTASALGRSVHKRENELMEGLLAGPPETEPLRFIPSHLERIGDALEGVVRTLRDREDESAAFTERGMREVRELFDRSLGLLECARDLTRTGNQVLARHVELESMRFQEVASGFALAHEERLIDGLCQPRASTAYLAILDHLAEVTRHCRQIAHRVVASRAARDANAAAR
jgi:phosphate uptake regulator